MAGIYIHIPFCRKLCNYCDFYHLIDQKDYTPFLKAVRQEAILRKDYLVGEEISTIYFGGGTPSVLPIREISVLLDEIRGLFKVSDDCEITIELNPDDISTGYMRGLKSAGMNRISMGIQSWNDHYLKLLNRRHDAAGAARALNDTFEAGFSNVTIDLIYGLPGLTTMEWEETLDYTFTFDIKHLSAYHLTIEQGAVFGKMLEKGIISETDENESVAQFTVLCEKSEKAGFIQYEISNFGKEGYFSVHNSNYWRQVSYLGLGPSAHSFNKFSRQWNVRDLKAYIKAVNSGKLFSESEELDQRTRFNEYIMTSLRTMWGIDLEYIEKNFDKEGYDYIMNLSGKFRDYGMIKLEKNSLVLTNQGKFISDNIISEFMMP